MLTLYHVTDIYMRPVFSLLQERSEMMLIAEEVARTTAENAIRQMASESIKLSLGSQDLLDEEDEEPDAE